MRHKRKILILDIDEELLVVNPSSKYTLTIRNKSNKFEVEKSTDTMDKTNVMITNIDYSDLKKYVLFDEYYQYAITTDRPEEISRQLNNIMEYHDLILYGNIFDNKDLNIKNIEYQCIVYY